MIRFRNNSSIFSGTIIYLSTNVINSAIPLFLLPILTRYLNPAEYGEVAIFQVLVQALASFIGLEVIGAAGRKYFDKHLGVNELADFVSSCLQVVLTSSTFVGVFVFLFREKMSQFISLPAEWIMWAVFVSTASIVIQLRLGQWQIRKAALSYGVLQVTQSIFNMLLSIALVVVLEKGADGRITAYILSSGVIASIAIYFLRRDGLLSLFVWKPESIKEALQFGLPLIPHSLGIFLLSSVDRIIITKEMGISEAGIYMVAVQLCMVMGIVFNSINNAYAPWLFEQLSQGEHSKKVKIVRYTYVGFFLIIILVFIANIIGPLLVKIIAGPQYVQAGSIIGWLALGQGFLGMQLAVINYIYYSKKNSMISFSSILTGLIYIVLLIYLTRLLGLEGAGMAFSLSMGLRFFVLWFAANNNEPMPWFSFYK